jgi:hypothetical protein
MDRQLPTFDITAARASATHLRRPSVDVATFTLARALAMGRGGVGGRALVEASRRRDPETNPGRFGRAVRAETKKLPNQIDSGWGASDNKARLSGRIGSVPADSPRACREGPFRRYPAGQLAHPAGMKRRESHFVPVGCRHAINSAPPARDRQFAGTTGTHNKEGWDGNAQIAACV